MTINRQLANPRGLSDGEAQKLAAEGKPFYLLYATIHSTEVSNGQAIIHIVHRLATDSSPATREILDNAVVLLIPSVNPDGQHLVIDHWYKTKGTPYARVYPDLYRKYVGHDDNRDWFMLTQKETRMNVELVQNNYRPIISHDMHQQGPNGSRIFVPPFTDPFDVNIHPILALGQATVGQSMAAALIAEGKEGVAWVEGYDMWTPARQYMVYHGQPRILTEIANSGPNLADPYVNPQKGQPLGPQESRWNFPIPYSKDTWTLGQQMDYGVTAAMAGIAHVAKYGREWLYNFYRVHRDWVNYDKGPYAFIVPATQRDQFATFEMLEILETADVEIHRATAAFSANGRQYPAGSYVVKTAQPYGAFAKTMLEKQVYPDLRIFPGGPPEPPYDVTGHTLWMLMGVTVDAAETAFEAPLELVKAVAPIATPAPARPKAAYVIGPESYGVFKLVTELQKAQVPIVRAAAAFDGHPAGSFLIPSTAASQPMVEKAAASLGLVVTGVDQMPAVDGFRLKPGTRVGLWKGANNMPGGWLLWLLEQYGITHEVVKSQDFAGDLNQKYRRPPAAHGNLAGPDRQRARSEAPRSGGVVVGLRRRRHRLAEAEGVRRERRDAPGHRLVGRDGDRAARSADREGVARSAAAVRPGAGRRRPGLRGVSRSDAPRRLLQPGPADADAARSRRRSDVALLLPGLAAPERVRHRQSGGLGHAGVVADLLRERSGLPSASRLRRRDQGGGPLSAAGHPAERLAARRGVPEGSGQRSVVSRRQGLRGHLRLAGGLPYPAAGDVPADLQRDVPRTIHAGDRGRAAAADDQRLTASTTSGAQLVWDGRLGPRNVQVASRLLAKEWRRWTARSSSSQQ